MELELDKKNVMMVILMISMDVLLYVLLNLDSPVLELPLTFVQDYVEMELLILVKNVMMQIIKLEMGVLIVLLIEDGLVMDPYVRKYVVMVFVMMKRNVITVILFQAMVALIVKLIQITYVKVVLLLVKIYVF